MRKIFPLKKDFILALFCYFCFRNISIIISAVGADTNGFADGSGIISDHSGSTSPAHCSFDGTHSISTEYRSNVTDPMLVRKLNIFHCLL